MITTESQVTKKCIVFFAYYSYQEFLEQTKKPDFQQDEGWKGLDEQPIYSNEEYEAYRQMEERRRQEAIQNMVAKEMVRA